MYSIHFDRQKIKFCCKIKSTKVQSYYQTFSQSSGITVSESLDCASFFSLAGATAEKVASENMIVIYSFKLG